MASLCRLTVGAFAWGWPKEGYEAYDLHSGICYAEGLIEMGYRREPFYDFELKAFADWCKKELEKMP